MSLHRPEPDRRRNSIIAAATPLFARKGFSGTTTRDIAQAAGVSEALLYRHFRSKEELFQAMLCEGEKTDDPVFARIDALPPSTSSLVLIVGFVVRMMTGLYRSPEKADMDIRHRLLITDLVENGQFAAAIFARMEATHFQKFLPQLEAAEASGDLLPGLGSARNRMWQLYRSILALALTHLSDPPAMPHEGSAEEACDDAARFLLRGLGLTPAAIAAHYNPQALKLLMGSARPMMAE